LRIVVRARRIGNHALSLYGALVIVNVLLPGYASGLAASICMVRSGCPLVEIGPIQ
jgi:hypothetical protein